MAIGVQKSLGRGHTYWDVLIRRQISSKNIFCFQHFSLHKLAASEAAPFPYTSFVIVSAASVRNFNWIGTGTCHALRSETKLKKWELNISFKSLVLLQSMMRPPADHCIAKHIDNIEEHTECTRSQPPFLISPDRISMSTLLCQALSLYCIYT